MPTPASSGSLESKTFEEPDEVRTAPKTRVEIVRFGGYSIARFTFEPGWRWSECVGPIAGTERCMLRHAGVALAGRFGIELEDGTTTLIGPGSAYVIPPGHDGWVEGDEAFVGIELESAEELAKG